MAWHGEKGRYTKPLEITARRMLLTAKRLGLGDAQANLCDLITQAPSVVSVVRSQLPPGFPEGVADPVLAGLAASAAEMQRQLL